MRLLSLLFLLLFSAPAQAANTWLCNATSETLYVSVRHYAPSLFVQNARTEGWKRLPTRGVTRSCWVRNRTARDHIVVVGVLRGSQIVPVKLTPRGYRPRNNTACVPKSAGSFEYRSGARFDQACGAGYQLAPVSFSVLGGTNDVDIDLKGRINVALSPSQKKKTDQAARRAAEEARKKKAASDALTARVKRLSSMASGNYLAEVEKIRKGADDESIANWDRYLSGQLLRFRDKKNGYDILIALQRARPDIGFLDFINRLSMVTAVPISAPPPQAMADFLRIKTFTDAQITQYSSDFGEIGKLGNLKVNGIKPKGTGLFNTLDSAIKKGQIFTAFDVASNSYRAFWTIAFIPENPFDLNSATEPALCFTHDSDGNVQCTRLRLFAIEDAGYTRRLDTSTFAKPNSAFTSSTVYIGALFTK